VRKREAEDDRGVDVQVVYVDGCPSRQTARERLVRALLVGAAETDVSLPRGST
jgi:hypothetical protein